MRASRTAKKIVDLASYVEFRGCNDGAFHLRAHGDTFSVLAANMSLYNRLRWFLTGKTN